MTRHASGAGSRSTGRATPADGAGVSIDRIQLEVGPDAGELNRAAEHGVLAVGFKVVEQE